MKIPRDLPILPLPVSFSMFNVESGIYRMGEFAYLVFSETFFIGEISLVTYSIFIYFFWALNYFGSGFFYA